MRFDHVSLLVTDVIRSALGIFDPQKLPFSRAYSDGEDPQVRGRRFFRGSQSSGILVFSIGEKNHDFIILAFFESGQSGFDSLGQSSAALWNDVHVQGIDTLPKSGIIDRERALQEGAAGEGD